MATFADMKLISQNGNFGDVWLCQREPDGQQFAKKVLKKSDPDSIEDFAREVRLLRSLSHPNIVQIVTMRLQKPPYWYIMPVYATTLEATLSSLHSDEARINKIFLAILDGMAYAHSEGVIHRDLKPGNILMNSDTDVVISDFGLAARGFMRFSN